MNVCYIVFWLFFISISHHHLCVYISPKTNVSPRMFFRLTSSDPGLSSTFIATWIRMKKFTKSELFYILDSLVQHYERQLNKRFSYAVCLFSVKATVRL